MSVSSMAVLSRTFQNTNDLGAKAIQADAMIVFDGYESDMPLLCKQFPWPVATTGDPIEFYGPLGQKMVQPKQVQTQQSGPIAFYETRANTAGLFLKAVIAAGGVLNGTVYQGRVDDNTGSERILNVILVIDTPSRDWENESQVLTLEGTCHYHWFASQ